MDTYISVGPPVTPLRQDGLGAVDDKRWGVAFIGTGFFP